MAQSRTTLSKMSKALNLSISTISKSLSDSSEISDLTKNRVKKFADQCNYVPNHFAVSFRKGFSNTIGLIIPNMLNPFYAKVLIGVENYLDKKGYRLMTSISNESKDKEEKSLKKMMGGYVDGLIVCASKETELSNEYNHINAALYRGMPLVMFDRISEMINCDKVISNDYQAAYNTTTLLIKKEKCKHIILTSLINDLYHGQLRTQGFKDAIKDNSDRVTGEIIIAKNKELLDLKLRKALKENINTDAVFGANEAAVLKALHLRRELKSAITIAGFCNQRQSEAHPSLLIVDQNAEKIGIECAKLLLKRIGDSMVSSFQTKTVSVNFS